MYATMCGYRVNWTARQDRLLLVSVGTGMADPKQAGEAVGREQVSPAHFAPSRTSAGRVYG